MKMFWAFVDRRERDECWPWKLSHTGGGGGGYGRTTIDGQRVGAHRAAYELTHGPIPAGLHVLHTCDNPPCCNPAHLFLGTQVDNNADMFSKGRNAEPPHPEGEAHGYARLTETAVAAIRGSRRHESSEVLAREYGVTGARIRQVRRGEGWRMVKVEKNEGEAA